MITKKDVIKKIIEKKPMLKKEYYIVNIGLFGSFSENNQTKDSDIDILVEFSKPIGWKFFALEKYLEQIFSRKIDLLTKKSIKKQIKPFILNQIIYL